MCLVYIVYLCVVLFCDVESSFRSIVDIPLKVCISLNFSNIFGGLVTVRQCEVLHVANLEG